MKRTGMASVAVLAASNYSAHADNPPSEPGSPEYKYEWSYVVVTLPTLFRDSDVTCPTAGVGQHSGRGDLNVNIRAGGNYGTGVFKWDGNIEVNSGTNIGWYATSVTVMAWSITSWNCHHGDNHTFDPTNDLQDARCLAHQRVRYDVDPETGIETPTPENPPPNGSHPSVFQGIANSANSKGTTADVKVSLASVSTSGTYNATGALTGINVGLNGGGGGGSGGFALGVTAGGIAVPNAGALYSSTGLEKKKRKVSVKVNGQWQAVLPNPQPWE